MNSRKTITYHTEHNSGVELIRSKGSSISYPEHIHVESIVFGLVTKGEIFITRKGKRERLTNNDTFFIPPYTSHNLTANSPYSLITFCIKNFSETTYDKKWHPQCLRILLSLQKQAALTQAQASLFTHAFDDFSYSDIPIIKVPFNKLISHILTSPEDTLSLDEIKKLVGLSKYHLIREFKKEVGLSPHQFIVQRRIRKAQHLLHSSTPLADIALQAGFYDQSHLTKEFSQMFGLSPCRYRSSLKG